MQISHHSWYTAILVLIQYKLPGSCNLACHRVTEIRLCGIILECQTHCSEENAPLCDPPKYSSFAPQYITLSLQASNPPISIRFCSVSHKLLIHLPSQLIA